MISIVPQWNITIQSMTGLVGKYKISADNLHEVMNWIQKINTFPHDITSCLIERVKE